MAFTFSKLGQSDLVNEMHQFTFGSFRRSKLRIALVASIAAFSVLFLIFMGNTTLFAQSNSGSRYQYSSILSKWGSCHDPEDPACQKTRATADDVLTSFPRDSDLALTLRSLFRPQLQPVTAREFLAEDGNHYLIQNKPIWTSSLGKELCLLETDNRPFTEEGQPWASGAFSWEKQKDSSSGIFNHYIYSIIHGYRYIYLQNADYPSERLHHWTKIPAISDMLLSGCRIVVKVDHDAIFSNLNLPLEWLLNRWNFTKSTSLAMALDNHWQQNEDDFGVLNINAGFIVAQNLPRTHEILRAWDSCPSNETMYPGCRKFITGWPAEQGAFGNFIRRQFNESTDLLNIPCTEANGFPGMGTECFGVFIRHFTTAKERVDQGVANSIAQAIFGLVRNELIDREHDIKVLRKVNDFTKSFSYEGGGVHGDPSPSQVAP